MNKLTILNIILYLILNNKIKIIFIINNKNIWGLVMNKREVCRMILLKN